MTRPKRRTARVLEQPDPRLAAQGHFRTPQRQTPFHARIAALMSAAHWYDWAGHAAPSVVQDEELEYFAIRSTAALFDLSPLIKYRIHGPEAEPYLNRLTLRDVARLRPGRVQYTAWCDDDGFVLDDGTLFRLGPDDFRLCCQERHLPWLLDAAAGFDVAVGDETETIAGLSLQGPTSAALLRDAGFDAIARLKPFEIVEARHAGGMVTLSRTGFTGDLGYELFVPPEQALSLWDRLWSAGEGRGVRAVGYNALNRARIEAGFIVANADFVPAGQALRPDRARRPDEIGLGWMVNPEKRPFNGRRAILKARADEAHRFVLVGLDIEGNEPATLSIVYHRKRRDVGVVTAATWSPTAKRNIGIASLERPYGLDRQDDLWVEIYALRELRYLKLMKRARVVERPFIRLARRTMTPPADF